LTKRRHTLGYKNKTVGYWLKKNKASNEEKNNTYCESSDAKNRHFWL